MSEQDTNRPEAASAAATGTETRFFDRTSLTIIGGFTLAALIVMVVMLPGYRHSRDTALADRYYKQKEYAKAIPYLKAIIKEYPGAWMRIKMLGDCYLLMGDPKDAHLAQEYYQKVLENPDYQQVLNNASTDQATRQDLDLNEELGICASLMGNEKKALEYFTKVLAQEPDSPAANYFEGLQYFKQGNYRQAARCFQNAATGDHDVAESAGAGGEDSPEAPKPSRWGDHWSKLAAPYRKEIAQKILDAPLTPPPAERNGAPRKG